MINKPLTGYSVSSLLNRWNAPLLYAERSDDILELTQIGILRTPGIETIVEPLQ